MKAKLTRFLSALLSLCVLMACTPALAEGRETVYVVADASGAAGKTFVSVTQSEESGMRETDAELPVRLTLSYSLDGAPLAPEDIAGRDGRAVLRIDYENRTKRTVQADGAAYELCVPFAALTAVVLDGERFQNVEVENGVTLSDGDRILALGWAFPGLKENLAGARGTEKIPGFVEISADAADFELLTTVTAFTSDAFALRDAAESLLAEVADRTGLELTLGDLPAQVRDLLADADSLAAGMTALADGAKELQDGASSLSDGATQLSDGAKTLKDGADTLSAGLTDAASGTDSLAAGLAQLAENSGALTGGARQVFDTLLAEADAQLAAAGLSLDPLTPETYADTLKSLLASLSEEGVRETARAQVEQAVRENENAIREKVNEVVERQVTAAVLDAAGLGMTAEQYAQAAAAGKIDAAAQSQIEAAVAQQMAAPEIAAQADALVEEQIALLVEQNMETDEVQAQMTAALQAAAAGFERIATLKAQLDSYGAFYQGILTYTAGVSDAKAGAEQLQTGMNALTAGGAALAEGAATLDTGAGDLKTGAAALADGTVTLAEGTEQLRDVADAITDLLGRVRDDGVTPEELAARVQSTFDLAEEYSAFDSDADYERVLFIVRTDAVEKK